MEVKKNGSKNEIKKNGTEESSFLKNRCSRFQIPKRRTFHRGDRNLRSEPRAERNQLQRGGC